MKYCQNPKCHLYDTDDRLKGVGKDKTYQTRKRSSFGYGGGNFCTLKCQDDWFDIYANRAIDYFGRIIKPKKRNVGTPDIYSLRNQVINTLYGNDYNAWDIDWTRVNNEMDRQLENLTTQ